MPAVPREEYGARVAAARRLMRQHGIDGLIVTDPVNFYYFSGQSVSASTKMRPGFFILPLEGEPVLITWSGPGMFARLYNRPYPSWVEDRRIYPEIPLNLERRVDWGVKDALADRGLAAATLGIELGKETCLAMPLDDFFLLREQLPAARFVDSSPVTWGCRMIKSEWEIDCARRACAIGGAAWKRCLEELRPGISTAAIQKKILGYYYEGGADLTSDPPLVLGARGPDGTFQNGDALYLDSGCSYMGYRMDFTRRAVFGKPSERQRAEHDEMWDILFKVMDRMKPGVPTREIFAYSQSLLAKTRWHNYSDHPAKRIGHGIGLETEPPSLNEYDPYVLQERMVVTPEPKIESPDGLINPEEHVVIRAHGCEILSTTPDWKLFVVE